MWERENTTMMIHYDQRTKERWSWGIRDLILRPYLKDAAWASGTAAAAATTTTLTPPPPPLLHPPRQHLSWPKGSTKTNFSASFTLSFTTNRMRSLSSSMRLRVYLPRSRTILVRQAFSESTLPKLPSRRQRQERIFLFQSLFITLLEDRERRGAAEVSW